MRKLRPNFEALAAEYGFESVGDMMRELYERQGMGIIALKRYFVTTDRTIEKLLRKYGIEQRRKRGGRNRVKVVVTPALVAEVHRDGVPLVARKLGVTTTAVNNAVKMYEHRRHLLQQEEG